MVHKGRQEIGILGNKTSVPQRSARSWPQRRRSFLVLFVADAVVVVISVSMIVILVTVMLFAKVAVVLVMSVVAVHAFGEFLEIA